MAYLLGLSIFSGQCYRTTIIHCPTDFILIYLSFSTPNIIKFLMLGDPNPVTKSHPFVQEKVPDFPCNISLKQQHGLVYEVQPAAR